MGTRWPETCWATYKGEINIIPKVTSSYYKIVKQLNYQHKHQGLDPLIRSVSRVTVARANASSVFQLYYYRCRQIIATNLGKHRLTRHRSALPANPTSSRPRSWSLGNITLVVAERSGWRRVLGASKPRPSAKGAHPYRKRACLEALVLATTKRTQRGTGYPSWGHPTQFRISRGSTGLIHKWQLRLHS